MERWEVINAVQRMQDYIEQNLNCPITLSDLAKVAGYSQWHSARIFKELTGKAPFEYMRALRLTKAALLLRDKRTKVIDVAFDFVFDSHEGFTRAFSKQFGVSPKKYSNSPEPIQLFIPNRIREYYLTLQKGEVMMSDKKRTNTVFVQVVERPSRKLIIKRGIKATHYFEYCEEVECEVWGILISIKEAMYEPAGMWLSENLIKPGTSSYVQGVEVPINYAGRVPEGFDVIELPPCKMMVFQGEPYEDEKFVEAIEELCDVMKKYNPQIYGFEWADDEGPRFQLEPQGYRGYIEARPVKQINNK
ncbi:helix-turn-helix- domain containing protein, AraC type [Alkaliphilus metalliredigens QYMF]|uniref:Helix-turn-helix-domain containing protein, AraC type n=1 Tax=Alkaliphilus metalliredigens (strain QYMF) TaxID=293826 RepID=A6TN59_ALKMQ|nr:AraC family transcriptional regulator [Alkaliphilus metalliredigens]ABR47627.1 helix-turn-helix- domain containing protein, AraC type [Alkaliphilus metalliredigens QYMF]